MMDSVKDFVNAIGDGDNLSAETHFNNYRQKSVMH